MALIAVSLAVVAYALVSRRLSTTPVTGPMVFMILGVLLGPEVSGVIHGADDRQVIEVLLDAALALVLFTDALGVRAGTWRTKRRLSGRLLLVGMPFMVLIGWVVARGLFSGIDVWEAALIAICLAPADAAVGQDVVTNPRVPGLIRQTLNIESGLNDGLALPFLLALTAAAEAEQVARHGVLDVFFRSLVLAAVIGLFVGGPGARLLLWAQWRGWIGKEWTRIATLGLVLLAFAAADAVQGSGFIATWVAGAAFGRVVKDRIPDAPSFAEDLGGLLATVSFLGFGAILLGPILGHLRWQVVLYAALSLTLIRMVPVAVSLIGTRLRRPTVLYIGWFGPRGLASIVFGLLVAKEALPNGSAVLDAVFLTVAASVVLHGATAVAGANRYGRWYERAAAADPDMPESQDVGETHVGRRLASHGVARGPSPNAFRKR